MNNKYSLITQQMILTSDEYGFINPTYKCFANSKECEKLFEPNTHPITGLKSFSLTKDGRVEKYILQKTETIGEKK